MIEFHPFPGALPIPGLVLRVGDPERRYLRLTHVFDDCLYYMWVSEPERVRYVRRPQRSSWGDIKRLAAQPASVWGHIALPPVLSEPPQSGSVTAQRLEAAWISVEPLISAFEHESNLSRTRFTALIRNRADAIRMRFLTLERLVRRFYYFGGTRLALNPLPTGAKAGLPAYPTRLSAESVQQPRQIKRRGRQSTLASELGANDFIVDDEDIAGMVETLNASLRAGPTFITNAYEEYLRGSFRKRHPEIYANYVGGKRVEPVTLKQYRYYVGDLTKVEAELVRNLRTKERDRGFLGSLHAVGPGEVYEIDSTGGRLHLVSTTDPPVQLGTPTIYLIIDRWSRFVVSVYLSLRAPSYEEVRHALMIAFTSRASRFNPLGIDIDDSRWPVGRMPAQLCPDRGSDFMSKSMEQAVAHDLRIDLTPLPPFCPDGKAIVERLIREIKRRMASSRLKGVFADKPMDPFSKRVARNAATVAVHSLVDAYRLLVEIIVDHNNRPHKALRRRRILAQAGVKPTPKESYLWGLEHITGLRTAPLTEDDYRRLLLSVDKASIASGVLRYKARPYLPANEAAIELAGKSTTHAKQILIRIDKTSPHEVWVSSSQGTWATFRITSGAASELALVTLAEEEALAPHTALLWARAEHESRIGRLASKVQKARVLGKNKGTALKVAKPQQNVRRNLETVDLKQRIFQKIPQSPSDTQSTPLVAESWSEVEENELLRSLEKIRQHRDER